MPYRMKKNDKGEFCIHNSETGENKGCSATRKMAVGHMRALYAAEGGATMGKKEIDELVTKAIEESEAEHLKMYGEPMMEYVPYGVTTFSALDEYRASQEAADEINSATHDLMSLIGNVMGDPEVEDKVSAIKALADEYGSRISEDLTEMKDLEAEDKATKSEGDGNHPSSHYLVVEDPEKPTTWHLRVKNASGKNDHRLMGAAWAALHEGYRGNKYAGPKKSEALSKLKGLYASEGIPTPDKKKDILGKARDLLDAVIDRLFAEEKEIDLEGTSLVVFKDKRGDYRWLARYSNNIRDDDRPREIISSASHRRFVERVDKGLAPYPDLQIWHEKEWTLGKADFVAYDDAGFALASGTFDPSLGEDTIKAVASLRDWRMSHGMPKVTIKRDEGDPTIITEHETREITYLPAIVAANKRTDFTIFEQKEEDMIPTDKKAVMKEWGLGEDQIAAIEGLNLFDAEKAKQEGVESKDTPMESTSEPEQPSGDVVDTPVETPVVEEAGEPAPVDVAAVIRDELAPLVERVAALEGEIKAVKESQEITIKALNDTPAASLGTILGNIRSAVGAEETRVDGRTSFAKDKPKEAPAGSTEGRTVVPFVNKLIAGS